MLDIVFLSKGQFVFSLFEGGPKNTSNGVKNLSEPCGDLLCSF